jgi:hypothetical protein
MPKGRKFLKSWSSCESRVNAERFTSYNLALRLVSLGCTAVYWYRGGVEAWQASDLPTHDLTLHEW